MTSDEALPRLIALLREAGVDLDRPSPEDVERTWSVFAAFAAEPVEDCAAEEEGDMFLAQFGAHGGSFQLDMTRQFSFEDAGGEYDHMSQLHCAFDFAETPELLAVGSGSDWAGPVLDDFFAEARELPGFAAVRKLGAVPLRLALDYWDV